jgi:hypothetical protein
MSFGKRTSAAEAGFEASCDPTAESRGLNETRWMNRRWLGEH